MKRTEYITILVCLLAVAVTVLVARCPRTVPLHKCSEVYQRYVGHEGIAAAYIQDFPVNDTLTVAVTLLEATDSAGWEYLLQAFNIPHELTEIEGIDVWTWKALRNQPEKRYEEMEADRQRGEDEPEIEIVAISTKTQKISVFHTKNAQERSTIFNKKIESNI